METMPQVTIQVTKVIRTLPIILIFRFVDVG